MAVVDATALMTAGVVAPEAFKSVMSVLISLPNVCAVLAKPLELIEVEAACASAVRVERLIGWPLSAWFTAVATVLMSATVATPPVIAPMMSGTRLGSLEHAASGRSEITASTMRTGMGRWLRYFMGFSGEG